jgi:hypothetical protein
MQKTLLIILSLVSSVALAQWNTNPSINTPVCIATKSQSNTHAVPDTKGGAIIVWDDNRNSVTGSTDIYAQRIKNNGFGKWTTNGIAVCSNTLTQKSVAITGSGIDGSAIVTWEDNRAGNNDIYAQKIDSSGNVLWTIDGIAVCSKTTSQKNPKLISDNAGGAIIVWEDSVNFYWDVYAQRISSSGTLLWTAGGVAVCAAPNIQINPKIDVDDLGGAVITWQDKRNSTDYDIYAQRLNSAGIVQWAANGVVVCNSNGVQNNPRIEPDGSNGALISWIDKRVGTDYDIYAQRISASGTAMWSANGVAVCSAANNQTAQDMKYLGSNGVVIAWKDDRNGKFDIYTQQLNLSGVAQLANNGVLLSNPSSIKSINPNTISDGLGGSIIAWQDSTAVGFDVYSQKLNSAGNTQWTIGGVAISIASDDQVNPTQVIDGNGGAIYAWEDRRNAVDYEIYAHHIYSIGNASVVREITADNKLVAAIYPNPISNNSIIELTNNAKHINWEIFIFDIYGKQVKRQLLNVDETYNLNTSELSSGIYFYSVELTDKSASTKGKFIYTR